MLEMLTLFRGKHHFNELENSNLAIVLVDNHFLELRNAVQNSCHGCHLLTSPRILSKGVLAKFFNQVLLTTLKSAFGDEVVHNESIFVTGSEIKRSNPLLVCFLEKAVVVMDLTKFFYADPHAVFDQGFHLVVYLTLLPFR
jgi:hypothetical protein